MAQAPCVESLERALQPPPAVQTAQDEPLHFKAWCAPYDSALNVMGQKQLQHATHEK